MSDSDRFHRDLERVLNPTELRGTLLLASLYVLAFETLKERVLSHVRMLYWTGIDETGHRYDEEGYRRELRGRHRDPLQAALLWFREMNAIDDTDLLVLHRLRESRNAVVHELAAMLGTDALATRLQDFNELLRVFRKVEVWWIVNFELDADPDWVGREIEKDKIMPGSMMMLQILHSVALGKDNDAWAFYREFTKHHKPANSSRPSSRDAP